ncbi:MAG: glycosyltransferase family 2 protein [Cyclobacteriaceae bacterium]
MDSSHVDENSGRGKCCTIIVTYNGAKWIENCISSLASSSFPTDVLIIDNGSTDNTLDIVERLPTSTQIVKTNENLGFGGANNIGMKLALKQGYDYFFLLNQDTWVEPDAIEFLIEGLTKNPEYGILSPIHMNGKGDAFDKNFEKFTQRNKFTSLPFDQANVEIHTSPIEVTFVNAAAWMLPRTCIQKVGVFHPLFHHYAEDNNYCHRVTYQGMKIGILKESIIYHDREYRNDSYSAKMDFDRETVKSLLNPNKNLTLVHSLLIAFAKIIEISTKIKFYKIPGFFGWAFFKFFVLRKRVKDFDGTRLYKFELQ